MNVDSGRDNPRDMRSNANPDCVCPLKRILNGELGGVTSTFRISSPSTLVRLRPVKRSLPLASTRSHLKEFILTRLAPPIRITSKFSIPFIGFSIENGGLLLAALSWYIKL